jgi:hypothetical protein
MHDKETDGKVSALSVSDNGEGKEGRPTKYTPELVDRLLAALADGLNKTQACKAVGIGVSTLADWLKLYPKLSERLDEAREKARQNALAEIKAAGSKDWRAWDTWLQRSFQADYKQPGTKVDVKASATGQQATALVCTEEERQRLISQRERLLARRKAEAITPLQALKTPEQRADMPKAEETSPLMLLEPLGPDEVLEAPQEEEWE